MNVILLLSVLPGNSTWYLLPLAVVVSLAYSASRFESSERILRHAWSCCVRIILFMAIVLALLWWLSFRL